MKRTDWKNCKIGDLCEVGRGSSPRPIISEKYFKDGKIPWIKIADATKSQKYLYETKEHVNDYGASFSRLLKKGSLIMATSGTLGFTIFLGVDGCIHDGWLYMSNFNGVNKNFLYYFLKNNTQYFYNMGSGAAIQNVNTDILRNTPLLLPSMSEQEKVSQVLSNYDDLIDNNSRRIQLLESMAKLLYDEWFVKFKFPSHETVKIVDSGTDFGETPKGWQVKRMSDFGDVITGKTPPTKDEENYGEIMQFIKTPDMHNNLFVVNTEQKLSEKGVSTQKKKTLPPNSIIVSCIGTVGVASINAFPCQTNQQINTVVLNKQTHREYLYFLCKSLKTHLENLGSNGATMGNVNKEKFQSVKVLYPDEKILELYSNMCAPMFQQIKELQLKNQNLAIIRDLLLPKLISGELDVSELDIGVSGAQV